MRPAPEIAAAQAYSESEMRRIAGRLETENPKWIVVYGVYSRLFIAFPRFSAPAMTIVLSAYPGALPARMRIIEQEFAARP
jgi:hypothetical protein